MGIKHGELGHRHIPLNKFEFYDSALQQITHQIHMFDYRSFSDSAVFWVLLSDITKLEKDYGKNFEKLDLFFSKYNYR